MEGIIINEINKVKSIFERLDKIAQTPGKNDKKELLKKQWEEQDETYNKVLTFLLDTMIVTHVSTKKIGKKMNLEVTDFPKTIEELLVFLEAGKASTDLGVAKIQYYMKTVEDQSSNIKDLVTKKYKIGASAKSLNEAVGDKVINIFSCQLAKKYEDVIASHEKKASKLGEEVLVAATLKLDGFRCVAITKVVDGERVVTFYTRSGKEIDGLDHIAKSLKEMLDNSDVGVGFVFDGELLSKDGDWSSTAQQASAKDNNKSNLDFYVFDALPLEEFWYGESTLGYYERKSLLHSMFEDLNSLRLDTFENLKFVTNLEIGTPEHCINKLMPWVRENGYEGLMFNILDSKYVTKRTSDLMKVKEFHTDDLLVLEVFEGEGSISGLLGGVIVDYKGNKVRVGSGFNLEQRNDFWKNPSSIIGKVIEVQYFEESTNIKDSNVSLRFPTFKGLRPDKTIDDVNYES